MRRSIGVLLIVLLVSSRGFAQDEPKPEQLKKMYEDALASMRAAQDRKNALAIENEKLNARITALQQELDQAKTELAGYSEKTFFLRAHYAAWQAFIGRYPHLQARWKGYMESGYLNGDVKPPDFMDPQWPLSAIE